MTMHFKVLGITAYVRWQVILNANKHEHAQYGVTMAIPALVAMKFSLCFEALGDKDSGWTESYYSTAASDPGTATALAVKLAGARVACMQNNVTLPWCRTTLFPVGTSTSQLVSFKNNQGGGSPGALVSNGEAPVVKGLLRLVNTLGTYTKQPFGGIPAANFGINGVFIPGNAFTGTFFAFIAFLAANGFCTRKQIQGTAPFPGGGPNQKYLISAVGPGNLVTVPLSGFTVGQNIKLGRCPRGFGVNKTWKVSSVAGTTYQFYGFPALAAAIPLFPASYAQLIQYQFSPIQPVGTGNLVFQTAVLRQSQHKPGRPTNPATGRRKRLPA
jgi:hypothetical protein